MVHYSVLIAQQDAGDGLGRLLPGLCQSLDRLLLPYEIICIDDASPAPTATVAVSLLDDFPRLRLLRFDQPRGASASLSAGIAAARGDVIIANNAGRGLSDRTLGQLIARLSQYDFVFARQWKPPIDRVCQRLLALARTLVRRAGLMPEEQFLWAARREAVSNLALARGTFRLLPGLVHESGYRACQLTFDDGLPPRGATYRPGRLERLALRLGHSFEPHLARELARGEVVTAFRPRLRATPAARLVPQQSLAPLDHDPHQPS